MLGADADLLGGDERIGSSSVDEAEDVGGDR